MPPALTWRARTSPRAKPTPAAFQYVYGNASRDGSAPAEIGSAPGSRRVASAIAAMAHSASATHASARSRSARPRANEPTSATISV